MTIDRELVTRKLALILADLSAVSEMAGHASDEFLRDRLLQAAAERVLERIIGRMIDINYHLITGSSHPPPADYFTSFLKLADLAILDRAFAERLAPSAGLRNRLVHEYDEIDPAKVFEAIARTQPDVIVYARAIEKHLSALEQ